MKYKGIGCLVPIIIFIIGAFMKSDDVMIIAIELFHPTFILVGILYLVEDWKEKKEKKLKSQEKLLKSQEKLQHETKMRRERQLKRESNHPVETERVENYIFNGSARVKSTSSSKLDDKIRRVSLKKNVSYTYINPFSNGYSIMNRDGTFKISFFWFVTKEVIPGKWSNSRIDYIEVNGYKVYREIVDETSLLDAMKDIILRMSQVNADEPLVIESFLRLCSHVIAQRIYHKNNKAVTNNNVTIWINEDEQMFEVRELLYPGYASKLESFVDEVYLNAQIIYENVFNAMYKSDETSMTHTTIYLQILEMTDISNPSIEEIKKQYRKLAKKYHPDIENGDEKHFRLITKAYEGILKEYSK